MVVVTPRRDIIKSLCGHCLLQQLCSPSTRRLLSSWLISCSSHFGGNVMVASACVQSRPEDDGRNEKYQIYQGWELTLALASASSWEKKTNWVKWRPDNLSTSQVAHKVGESYSMRDHQAEIVSVYFTLEVSSHEASVFLMLTKKRVCWWERLVSRS